MGPTRRMKLIQRMKTTVQCDLEKYLDSSRCFNATLLAEDFINEDEPTEEDEYFDTAIEVQEYAVETYNLNE
jgi:hypothetical protein